MQNAMLIPVILLSAPVAYAEAPTTSVSERSVAPLVAIQNTLVLKVNDREKTADALVELADELGGYFSSRTDSSLTLKVPKEKSERLLEMVEDSGIVVDRNYHARDVGFAVAEKRARLKSREAVLSRYFAVIEGATVDAVVSVEREMTQLVQEIESLRGELQMLEHRLAYAEIRVDFEFRDRRPPLQTGNSSFAWLNTLNLADLMREFSE